MAAVLVLLGVTAWAVTRQTDSVAGPVTGAVGALGGADSAQAANAGGSTIVVGLGDSVMSGTACDCEPFLTTYADRLAAHRGQVAHAVNLGVDGSTSEDLWTALRTDPATRSAVAGASVIVVTTGANDLEEPLWSLHNRGSCDEACVADAVAPMRRHVSEVLDQLTAQRASDAQVLVTTYWNVYPVGDAADQDFGAGFPDLSVRVTNAANRAIADVTTAHGFAVVDLIAAFGEPADQPGLLLPDGDHQDAEGNAKIVEALLAATTA